MAMIQMSFTPQQAEAMAAAIERDIEANLRNPDRPELVQIAARIRYRVTRWHVANDPPPHA